MNTRILLPLLLAMPFVVFSSDSKEVLPLLSRPTQTFIETQVFSSTYASCSGDIVTVEGTIILQHHIGQQDKQLTDHVHATFINVTGTSESSGVTYRITGIEDLVFRTFQSGETFAITGIRSFHLISQGGSDNLLIHQLHHLIFNPDGSVDRFINHIDIECR